MKIEWKAAAILLLTLLLGVALGALARKGLYVEPTSAAAGAGLTQLLASGAIKPGERTVLVLTGTGLKASEKIGELLNLRAREFGL